MENDILEEGLANPSWFLVIRNLALSFVFIIIGFTLFGFFGALTISSLLSGILAPFGIGFGLLGGVILGFFGIILFFINSFIYYVFSKILGGNGSLKKHFTLLSTIFLAYCFSIIPFLILLIIPFLNLFLFIFLIGSFILLLYGNYKSIKLVHSLSTFKSILIILLSLLLVVAICFFVSYELILELLKNTELLSNFTFR